MLSVMRAHLYKLQQLVLLTLSHLLALTNWTCLSCFRPVLISAGSAGSVFAAQMLPIYVQLRARRPSQLIYRESTLRAKM